MSQAAWLAVVGWALAAALSCSLGIVMDAGGRHLREIETLRGQVEWSDNMAGMWEQIAEANAANVRSATMRAEACEMRCP
jgi:hypothetical protein